MSTLRASLLIPVCFLLLSACNGAPKHGSIVVRYDQLANWHVFKGDDAGTTTEAARGMFVLYRLTEIENSELKARDFTLRVDRLFVHEPGGAESSLGTNCGAQLIRKASDVNVRAWQTVPGSGCIVLNVAGDPEAMKSEMLPLIYSLDGTEGRSVILQREAGDVDTFYMEQGTPAAMNSWCK